MPDIIDEQDGIPHSENPSVDRLCDGFGMSLLVGGFQAGSWFQNTAVLGAFGVLAPRYDWVPAWFTPSAPPAQEPFSSEDDSSDEDLDPLALALDNLITQHSVLKQQPQRACRRPLIIEESSSSGGSSLDEEEEADTASHILRAACHSVRTARCHLEQGIERTVRATQRTQHMKELVDEKASWVPDADRQLERFAASLDREVIVYCPVDNATMDNFEQ